jgi:hypothetical protein
LQFDLSRVARLVGGMHVARLRHRTIVKRIAQAR